MFSGDPIDNEIADLIGVGNPFLGNYSPEIEKEIIDTKTLDYGSDASPTSSEEDTQSLSETITHKDGDKNYEISKYITSLALLKILYEIDNRREIDNEKIDYNFNLFQRCIDIKNAEVDSLKNRLKILEEERGKCKEEMMFCFAERDKQMKEICSKWNTNFRIITRKRKQREVGEAGYVEEEKQPVTTRSGRECKKTRK